MLSDALTLKYLLITLAAFWGVLAVLACGRRYLGFFLGAGVFLLIAYLALGSGFSIRIPYHHDKMEILVHTVYGNRVHALAHPLNKPGEPMHIVFSIDPQTHPGAIMRKSFFDAVRNREEERHKTNIVIDMKRHMTDQGEFKHLTPPLLPPKGLPVREE